MKKLVLNKEKVFYLVMGLFVLAIIIAILVKVKIDFYSHEDKEVVKKNNLDSLEIYGYNLDDMDTELYKSYFNELKDVLNNDEIDYNNYAVVLTKLFITDFYTLQNKITSSDIGGVEFVHPDLIDNFKMNAGDTIYNHVKNNVYGDRVQDLPVVSNVTVDNCENVDYLYAGVTYEGFKVSATWEYEVDLGYENSGTFYLIKDNNKLNVVQK